jgi:peptidyl-prolyl cis-trans isomerase C
MTWWKTVVREPLVHFVVIGSVLFAVDAWRSSDEPARTEVVPAPAPAAAVAAPVVAPGGRSTVVIDADVRAQIASLAERRLGRAASNAELAEETERWIDEEILYREALARGLEKNDPVIHQRVAQQMSYVLQQAIIVPEPTEAELRTWFDAHRDTWAVAEHVDFTHVFFAGTDAAANARAADAATALAGGTPPERLGDRFTGGHRYRGRRIADLALAFGDDFVTGLATQPIGTWVRRTSKHGIHLVRVDRIDAPRAPDFAAARLDVRKQWMEARRAAEVTAAMKKLRESWTIERR